MSSEKRADVLLELIFALRRLQVANDRVDGAAAELMGLNRTDLRCLDLLLLEGGMAAGALGRAAGLSSGATTTAIDRLERAGYVTRTRDPDDRRRVLIAPTDEAQQAQDEIYTPLAEAGIRDLGRYTTKQLLLMRGFLQRGTQVTLEHADRLDERIGAHQERAEAARQRRQARRRGPDPRH